MNRPIPPAIPTVPAEPCPVCGGGCVGGLEAVDHYRYRVIPDHPATEEALMAEAKLIEPKYVLEHRILSEVDGDGGGRVLFGAGDEVRESVLERLGLLEAVRSGEKPEGLGFRVDAALLDPPAPEPVAYEYIEVPAVQPEPTVVALNTADEVHVPAPAEVPDPVAIAEPETAAETAAEEAEGDSPASETTGETAEGDAPDDERAAKPGENRERPHGGNRSGEAPASS